MIWTRTRALLAGSVLAVTLVSCSNPSTARPANKPVPTTRMSSTSATTPATRTVTIAKSEHRVTVDTCVTADGRHCPYVSLTTHGFSGSFSCDFFDTRDKNPWVTLRFSGDQAASEKAYYGFSDTLWVTCDGIQSNKVNW